MGDIVGPETALLVAQFARGVSGELSSVDQKITEGKRHLSPVKLDKEGLISSLTGATAPTPEPEFPAPSAPSAILPLTEFERQVLEHESQRGAVDRRLPYNAAVAPQAPSRPGNDSAQEQLLNSIMLSLVSIEKQLAMLHKAVKTPPTRKKSAQ